MAGEEEAPHTKSLSFAHQQSSRAEAFVKRGDCKRALACHQAATAAICHVIRSITDRQLADLRRIASQSDEFAALESLYAQLNQHMVQQSALLDRQLQLISARCTVKGGAPLPHDRHPSATYSQPVDASAGSPHRPGATRDASDVADEEKCMLIDGLRSQIDDLARKNEALKKENHLLKVMAFPAGTAPENAGLSSEAVSHEHTAGLSNWTEYEDSYSDERSPAAYIDLRRSPPLDVTDINS